MLIDEIEELNNTLYRAFGKLKENSGNINNPEHGESIANKIMELYELDYKLIYGRFEAEEKHADELDIRKTARRNELDRRKKELQPRTRRPWYFLFLIKRRNRADELTEREADANAGLFLNAKEKAVEELEKILEQADNAEINEAFDEPYGGQGKAAEPETADTFLTA